MSNPKTEGRGIEKNNPSPEFGVPPPFFARLAGVGVKAVSSFSPRFPLVFLFPLLLLAFYFPARRLSQIAKKSPLARKFGGAARVGGQRPTGRRSRLLPPRFPRFPAYRNRPRRGETRFPRRPGASLLCCSVVLPLSPARRHSQLAKESPLARKFGGVARVGGQRPTGRRSRLLPPRAPSPVFPPTAIAPGAGKPVSPAAPECHCLCCSVVLPLSPARRHSQIAKESLLARKFGGAARVGG